MSKNLEKAARLIRASDAHLLEAAALIRAAMEADPSLTLAAVGETVERSRQWVSGLLHWELHHEEGEALFASDTEHRLVRATKQGLRTISDEALDEMLLDTELLERVRTASVRRYWAEHSEQQEPITPESMRAYRLQLALSSRQGLWWRAALVRDHADEWTPEERAQVAEAFEETATSRIEEATQLLAEVQEKLGPYVEATALA